MTLLFIDQSRKSPKRQSPKAIELAATCVGPPLPELRSICGGWVGRRTLRRGPWMMAVSRPARATEKPRTTPVLRRLWERRKGSDEWSSPGRVAVPFCLRWPSWPRMRGERAGLCSGCSVGTCRSRFGLPGCACRVETAWPWWNKVLRSSLYLTIARSGAGDRIVRFEFAGFGDLVGAPDLAVSCTGVLCRLLCAVARSKGWRGGGWLRGGGAGARCSLASNGYWSWIREAWGVSPAEVPPCSVHVAAHFKACVRWSFFWSRCSRRLLPAPAVMASAEDSAGDGRCVWEAQKIFRAYLQFSFVAGSFV